MILSGTNIYSLPLIKVKYEGQMQTLPAVSKLKQFVQKRSFSFAYGKVLDIWKTYTRNWNSLLIRRNLIQVVLLQSGEVMWLEYSDYKLQLVQQSLRGWGNEQKSLICKWKQDHGLNLIYKIFSSNNPLTYIYFAF